jgi:hypothetical protein
MKSKEIDNCKNCLKQTAHAPCKCHICKDCCKECYNLKGRCKHKDLDGQVDFEE